jgi:hypothetical protein
VTLGVTGDVTEGAAGANEQLGGTAGEEGHPSGWG